MENKGLLKREIISEQGLERTGIKFNLSPLLNKLHTLVVKTCKDDKTCRQSLSSQLSHLTCLLS